MVRVILDPAQHHAVIAAALLVLAFVLGGGGSPGPAAELWLQLLAGGAAVAWLWQKGPVRLPEDRPVWLLAVLVLLLPVLHLIPLPPVIWQALPGRDVEVAALGLIDAADTWRPLSMSPARTLASLLAVVPPVILLLITAALAPAQRRLLVAVIACMALVSAVFGALQLSAGTASFRIHDQSPSGVVLGFQANRNSTADVLLIGMVALAAWWAGRSPASRARGSGGDARDGWWLLGGAALLALACILTGSRFGVLMLVPVAIAGWAIATGRSRSARKKSLAVVAVAASALAAGGMLLLQNNTALQKVAARFDGTTGREGLWPDVLYAIGQYWPFGSGMGTFVPTFNALEPLESVDPFVTNRAHNDFLELTLEAGAFGIAVLAVAAALVAVMAFRSWRNPDADRPQIGCAIAIFAIVALHSVFDYPLRSMSLASVTAVAAGLLAAPWPRRAAPEQSG